MDATFFNLNQTKTKILDDTFQPCPSELDNGFSIFCDINNKFHLKFIDVNGVTKMNQLNYEDTLQYQLYNFLTKAEQRVLVQKGLSMRHGFFDNKIFSVPIQFNKNSKPDGLIIWNENKILKFVYFKDLWEKLIHPWLVQFQPGMHYNCVYKSENLNFYNIKAYNPALNQITTFPLYSPRLDLDHGQVNHKEFLYLYNENKMICPFIFKFEFEFLETRGDLKYMFFMETNEEDIEIDIDKFNEKNGTNLFNTWQDIPDEKIQWISPVTVSELVEKDEFDFLLIKDKNRKVYFVDFEENAYRVHDTVNCRDIMGRDSYEYSIDPRYILSDNFYQNLKLKLDPDKRIFTVNDYISIRFNNPDYEINEVRFIAASEKDCGCEKRKCNNVIKENRVKFKSSIILYEQDSVEIIVNHHVDIQENEFINWKIPGLQMEGKHRIFKLRRNENETRFNLYIEGFTNQMVSHRIWEFEYEGPSYYHHYFPVNLLADDIYKDIHEFIQTNELPVDSFIDKESIVFVGKDANSISQFELCFNLSRKSKNQCIKVNEVEMKPIVFNFVDKPRLSDTFNFNFSEFSGYTDGTLLILHKNEWMNIEKRKDLLIQKDLDLEKLDTYLNFNQNEYHTNFFIDDILHDDYIGIVTPMIIDEHQRNLKICYKFYPKLSKIQKYF